jgi:hypothetical protein
MTLGDWPAQSPIEFRADTWRAKLGDAWPSAADAGQLSRQAVFGISDAHRRGVATTKQLLAAVGIWGYGKGGRGGFRVRHWLEEPALTTKLDAAMDLARSGDVGGAYGSLRRGAENHVDGLGPAFFTKLLYFAAYRRGQRGIQPLILDQYVALGLRQETHESWPSAGWSTDQYLHYLHKARGLADCPGGPGEVDLIEFKLFRAGKQAQRGR